MKDPPWISTKQSEEDQERVDYFALKDTEFHADFTSHKVVKPARFRGEREITVVEHWYRLKELGSGNFGTVHLEQERGGSLRAVKQIRKQKTNAQRAHYLQELSALASFTRESTNFVVFHGWFQDAQNLYIAMDYYKLGDLGDCVKQALSEPDARRISAQVASALHSMHELNITHRDIRPANILVASRQPVWWVKVADFGVAKRVDPNSPGLSTLLMGEYVAPEVYSLVDDGSEEDDSEYTNAVDIWSFGCLTHWLLTFEVPFSPDCKDLKKYCRGKSLFPLTHLDRVKASQESKVFIESLLSAAPQKRLTAKQALETKWLQERSNVKALKSTRRSLPLKPVQSVMNEDDSTVPAKPVLTQPVPSLPTTIQGDRSPAPAVPQSVPSLPMVNVKNLVLEALQAGGTDVHKTLQLLLNLSFPEQTAPGARHDGKSPFAPIPVSSVENMTRFILERHNILDSDRANYLLSSLSSRSQNAISSEEQRGEGEVMQPGKSTATTRNQINPSSITNLAALSPTGSSGPSMKDPLAAIEQSLIDWPSTQKALSSIHQAPSRLEPKEEIDKSYTPSDPFSSDSPVARYIRRYGKQNTILQSPPLHVQQGQTLEAAKDVFERADLEHRIVVDNNQGKTWIPFSAVNFTSIPSLGCAVGREGDKLLFFKALTQYEIDSVTGPQRSGTQAATRPTQRETRIDIPDGEIRRPRSRSRTRSRTMTNSERPSEWSSPLYTERRSREQESPQPRLVRERPSMSPIIVREREHEQPIIVREQTSMQPIVLPHPPKDDRRGSKRSDERYHRPNLGPLVRKDRVGDTFPSRPPLHTHTQSDHEFYQQPHPLSHSSPPSPPSPYSPYERPNTVVLPVRSDRDSTTSRHSIYITDPTPSARRRRRRYDEYGDNGYLSTPQNAEYTTVRRYKVAPGDESIVINSQHHNPAEQITRFQRIEQPYDGSYGLHKYEPAGRAHSKDFSHIEIQANLNTTKRQLDLMMDDDKLSTINGRRELEQRQKLEQLQLQLQELEQRQRLEQEQRQRLEPEQRQRLEQEQRQMLELERDLQREIERRRMLEREPDQDAARRSWSRRR